jgi:hypothetical protein
MTDHIETDLWSEATRDVEAERHERVITASRIEASSYWPFLAAAQTEAEFDNRLALIEDKIVEGAQRIATDEGVEDNVVPEILASLRSDWKLLHTAYDSGQYEDAQREKHAFVPNDDWTGHGADGTCKRCGRYQSHVIHERRTAASHTALSYDDPNRDRATQPMLGDQTACKICGQDIEYHGADGKPKPGDWIDRGGNSTCGTFAGYDENGVTQRRAEGQKHEPYSDFATASRRVGVSLDDIKNTSNDWKRVTWRMPDGSYEFTQRLMHRPGYGDENGERFTSADTGGEYWIKPEHIQKIEDDGPTTSDERRGRRLSSRTAKYYSGNSPSDLKSNLEADFGPLSAVNYSGEGGLPEGGGMGYRKLQTADGQVITLQSMVDGSWGATATPPTTASLHEANQYIKQQGGKWVITQKGTGKVLSHHDSKDKAEAAFAAMMQSKHGSAHTASQLALILKAQSEDDVRQQIAKRMPDAVVSGVKATNAPDQFVANVDGPSTSLQAGRWMNENLGEDAPYSSGSLLYWTASPSGGFTSTLHTAPGGGEHAPYRIKEEGGKYYVVNDEGEKKDSGYDTYDEAREHQKALYANVPGAAESAKEDEAKKSSSLHWPWEVQGDPFGNGSRRTAAYPSYDEFLADDEQMEYPSYDEGYEDGYKHPEDPTKGVGSDAGKAYVRGLQEGAADAKAGKPSKLDKEGSRRIAAIPWVLTDSGKLICPSCGSADDKPHRPGCPYSVDEMRSRMLSSRTAAAVGDTSTCKYCGSPVTYAEWEGGRSGWITDDGWGTLCAASPENHDHKVATQASRRVGYTSDYEDDYSPHPRKPHNEINQALNAHFQEELRKHGPDYMRIHSGALG